MHWARPLLAMQGVSRGFRFSIDRGGTFTDCYAEHPGGFRVLKLLSDDPDNYPDAPREAIRRVLEEVTGIPHPRGTPLDTSRIDYIRMGTTVATNALLERKGERCALVTSKGLGDLLLIGNQSRPHIFDLEIKRPDLLYEEVLEVDESVVLVKAGESLCDKGGPPCTGGVVKGVTGESVQVMQAPDLEALRTKLAAILARGITSLAVVFKHGYTFGDHERAVGKLAKEVGFKHVSLSSEVVMAMVKMVPRGYTTAADAYLTPIIERYIASFKAGFDDGFDKVKCLFMQSDGGLTPVDQFRGSRAILSGPAGGVVGYAATSQPPGQEKEPVVGFDMGGTSTDVSRYAGEYEHVFETVTAGITIQSPQLDISTVAAGGGSRLFFRNGLFVVGPESAGAHPGPVCYRKGGHLTVTDANLVLGRVIPKHFPSIFGPNEDKPLDAEGARMAMQELTERVNAHESTPSPKTVDEVAYGFIRVANEAMCRPIRNLTTMKGFDITSHKLACFGGAGPQHCCAMARALGMSSIIVHRFSGILSAYGLSLAKVVVEKQEPAAAVYTSATAKDIELRLHALEKEATRELLDQGFDAADIKADHFLNLRFQGTDTAIMTKHEHSGQGEGGCREEFLAQYRREFGFVLQGRDIIVDDIRVRCCGIGSKVFYMSRSLTLECPVVGAESLPDKAGEEDCYWEGLGRVRTPVYRLDDLKSGHSIEGPAVLIQNVSTVVIEPGCTAVITAKGDIEISVDSRGPSAASLVSKEMDPIYTAIFSHRFMGIAEQMGRTLQRTSTSVNIKERLDFSCALFDADGGLVANAPHLPVHLGAMQEAVRFQVKYWGDNLKEGDVLVSNHPQLAGGSHLPDITVITPVFDEGVVRFFVASRGHHADVGGIAPGSMPPLSKTLVEEGAAIVAFKLVENDTFDEEGISELLKAPGKVPGNSGTRNLADNLSDLKAQVAANKRGVVLMGELVGEYGLLVVSAYMGHIQETAEMAVRDMLVSFSEAQGLKEVDSVTACDFLDDGTPINLRVTIDRGSRSAVFDFDGTGHEVCGNLNAPPAVTASAVIYCLRCMVPGADIPLNQGCLTPVTINVPKGSLLNPSDTAAVVGGNVLTSQRVTDVILKAFNACAASQGCMNNLTFGDESMGYYETIAGGAGAGKGWDGCSGVHTHMTNTRITDPEIYERRYPVILRQFGLRHGSGGKGRHRGGDGVIREIAFRKPLTVSILSERRSMQPYGMAGGGPGERGLNLLTEVSGRVVSLGGKNTLHVKPGDELTILSPGGGGWGQVGQEDTEPGLEMGSEQEQRFEAEYRLGKGSYERRQETC
ncbi:unnamed protein product [Chrysoparadoxa australica]